jgi:tRNA (cytidine32/guanosine34-2'-O)-methyltransferase
MQQFQDAHAQLVVCNSAPDVTSLYYIDKYLQGQLVMVAVIITTHVFVKGGMLIAKVWFCSLFSLGYYLVRSVLPNCCCLKIQQNICGVLRYCWWHMFQQPPSKRI